jgi:hypothetical protein
MSMPLDQFYLLNIIFLTINIVKGFYIASLFFTRLIKDTLIEYICSPNCCVAPNVPVYSDIANKISCTVVNCRVQSRFSYFLNITSLTGKIKTQLSCAILQIVFLSITCLCFVNIAFSCQLYSILNEFICFQNIFCEK